jgi:hypothetical protein
LDVSPLPSPDYLGSCLCGSVTYRVQGPLEELVLCHCSRCRKATGSAFQAVAPIAESAFELLSGQVQLRSYESSAGVHRYFCGGCGSPLYSRRDFMPGLLRLRVGTLDTPLQISPAMHIFTGSKAPWFTIGDAAPQYDTRPGE